MPTAAEVQADAQIDAAEIARDAANAGGLKDAQARFFDAQTQGQVNQNAEVALNAGAARGLQLAETFKSGEEARQIAPNALANRGLIGAQTKTLTQLTDPIGDVGFRALYAGAGQAGINPATVPIKRGLGLKTGTAKVPGKGDGMKDTVDAKLAPGEAVLNKAAAEHLGRGLISLLNKLGRQKMGMPEPDEAAPAADGQQHFMCGTEEVMSAKRKR